MSNQSILYALEPNESRQDTIDSYVQRDASMGHTDTVEWLCYLLVKLKLADPKFATLAANGHSSQFYELLTDEQLNIAGY